MLDLLVPLGITHATTALLYPVLNNIAQGVAEDATKSYVASAFSNVFSVINKKALSKATLLAITELLDLIENELLDNDVSDERVRSMIKAVEVFLAKEAIKQALADAFLEPDYILDPKVFVDSWAQLPDPWPHMLPEDYSWQRIAKRFARKVRDIRDADTELKQTFDNLQQRGNAEALKELQGLPPDFDLDLYREALVEKFGNLNMESVDTTGVYYQNTIQLWSVFVPQSVRECHTYRPQLLELPKEHLQRLLEQGEIDEAELRELQKQETEQRSSFLEQPLQPVIELLKPENLDGNRMILGDPGSGKSSLLRFLALEWARNENVNQRYTQTLPLLIELRDYNRWQCSQGKSFLRYLHEAPTWHRLNQHTLDYLLKQDNRVLLLLDGLDEVFDPNEREQVMNDIHRFSNEYKHTRIIVTSRVVGYKAQRLRDAEFQDFMLQDLDDKQIEDFLQRWHKVAFTDQADGERKRERLAKAINNASSKMLAGNPLLLTMMAIINRYQELPRDRVLLYEKASEVLLQQWDTERGLQDFPGLSNDIDLRAKNAILRRIAYTMQTGRSEGQAANIIHGDALLKLIEDYLREQLHFEQARAMSNALIKQLRERNFILCFLGADSYAFVQRTFLEYYCAAELVYQFKDKQSLNIEGLIEVFDKYCRDDDWREVLRLVCGQIDEGFVGLIVEFLAMRTDLGKWNGETELPEMALAVWCLGEVKSLSKLTAVGELLWQQIVKMFQQLHYMNHSNEVLIAAEDIGTQWPGKHSLPNTLDWRYTNTYAQYQWASLLAAVIHDRQQIVSLIMNSESTMREGAIEALVLHWPDEDTRQLLYERSIQDESKFFRSTALEELGKNWPDANTRKLLCERAIEDEDKDARTAALEALVKTWPDDDTRRLLSERAVQDDDEDARSTALEVLVKTWPDDNTRKFLSKRTAEDEHENPRSTALKVLTNIWSDDNIRQLLVERAFQDNSSEIRCVAMHLLVKKWPDNDTQLLLMNSFDSTKSDKVRLAMANLLISNWWHSFDVRNFIRKQAKKNSSKDNKHKDFKKLIIKANKHLSKKWEEYFSGTIEMDNIPERERAYPAIKIHKFRLINIGAFSDTKVINLNSTSLFLGNNAAGKSTILKCLALAAIGSDAANEVEENASSYLRKGAEYGTIEVQFDLIPDPDCYSEEWGKVTVGLSIKNGSDRFTPTSHNQMTLSNFNNIEKLNELRNETDFSFGLTCAYGATRTFSDNRYGVEPELSKDENEWVIPLFRWDARVINSEVLGRMFFGDLRNIKNAPDKLQKEFVKKIQIALKKFVPELQLLPTNSSADINFNNVELNFSELSDGYRSLLTICGHFIRSSFKSVHWELDATQLHGCILIDEVDLHLHPSWQKYVVKNLQDAFPNIQFLLSSHSPLVAGYLDNSNIHLIQTDQNGSKTLLLSSLISETSTMKAWRADQILTGPGFGLESSTSVEADSWETEYDELCSIAPDKRTHLQKKRLDELSALLEREIPRWQETPRKRAAAQNFEKWALEKVLSPEAIEDTLQLLQQLDSKE